MSEFFPFQKPDPEEHKESMVYVTEEIQWEYQLITIDLNQKQPLTVEDLNQLGKDSWELAAVLNNNHQAFYYFKRPVS
jgi:hypothetical protein